MRKNRKMSESRRPSVSFTAKPPCVLVNDSRSNSTDDIQIALAPHIQTYLSQTGRRHSCCSVMLPVAFERASSKSWMDPKFDSPVLEGQFQTSVFPHVGMRYRFALSFILICSFSLFLYFLTNGDSDYYRRPISSAFTMLSLITATHLGFTHWDMYRAYRIDLCSQSLQPAQSRLHTRLAAVPMQQWLSAFIAVAHSVLFEVASPRTRWRHQITDASEQR